MAHYEKDTLKVVAETPQGYVIINREDFNPELHKPFEGKAAAPAVTNPQTPNLGGGNGGEVKTVLPGFDLSEVATPSVAARLTEAGLSDPVAILDATLETLQGIEGIGLRTAERLKEEAAKFVKVGE